MIQVPQELIDTILQEVEDTDSLKLCSLAASTLRGASQRRLLHSLTVNDGILGSNRCRSYRAACSLVTESTHLADYITRLTLRVSSDNASDASVQSLRQLLNKLRNVRRCTIEGDGGDSWDYLAPLMPVVFDFIQARNLTELHVMYLRQLPAPALVLLVSSTPTVSLYDVTTQPDITVDVPSAASESKLGQLLIAGLNTAGVCRVLERPEFASCTRNVRRLGLDLIDPMRFFALISAVASTVEHIWFALDLSGFSLPPSHLFPLLRSIDLSIEPGNDERRLVVGMDLILAAQLPALQEIIITYHVSLINTPSLRPLVLEAVDTSMGRSRAAPRIRWRLKFGYGDDVRILQCVAEFASHVQRAMPTLCEMGKLTFERLSQTDEWAIR
ncbi:hypothetical protein B0H11DRAFT_2037711 [Mycena galericulata]|nr:hypothetical protein B0H11DRAFT_2037711 [Mycena galericulata]